MNNSIEYIDHPNSDHESIFESEIKKQIEIIAKIETSIKRKQLDDYVLLLKRLLLSLESLKDNQFFRSYFENNQVKTLSNLN